MPISSAACHHLIFPDVARNNTSCSFIARSIAVIGQISMLSRMDHPHRLKSGHITCYKHRTYYVPTTVSTVILPR
jgi:hypothetical protein